MNQREKNTPAPRIPLNIAVEYRKSYARQGDMGTLKNISISGAFLQHQNPELQPDDKVSIEFQVSGRKRTVSASVIWCNNSGSGIRFLPYNKRDVQIVDDLMYFVRNSRENRRTVLESIFKKVS